MKVYVTHYDVSGYPQSTAVNVPAYPSPSLDALIRQIQDTTWYGLYHDDDPCIRIASEKGVSLANVYLRSGVVWFTPYFFYLSGFGYTELKPVKKWCICSSVSTYRICKNKWEAKRLCAEWNSMPCPMYGGDLHIEQSRYYV